MHSKNNEETHQTDRFETGLTCEELSSYLRTTLTATLRPVLRSTAL